MIDYELRALREAFDSGDASLGISGLVGDIPYYSKKEYEAALLDAESEDEK